MLLTAIAAVLATPIIDVHRHAGWAYSDKESARDSEVVALEDFGLNTAITSVTDYDEPERWADTGFIVGVRPFCPRNLAEPRYICFPSTEGWADLDWLEQEIKAGRVHALHEVNPNTYGISPDNPRLRPYWALAARYDIPVGIHTQRGPRPEARNSTRSSGDCCPDFDPAMGNPALALIGGSFGLRCCGRCWKGTRAFGCGCSMSGPDAAIFNHSGKRRSRF